MCSSDLAEWGRRHGGDEPPRIVFENPTVAQLACKLNRSHDMRSSPGRHGPGASEAALPDQDSESAILERQRAQIRTWQGDESSRDGWIFTLNSGGGRRGLFWCFQGQSEFQKLAAGLGPDQPLHGMRSGFLVMKQSATNLQTLAGVYAGEMIQMQPAGAFLLGGNCRGSILAHALAVRLRSLGRKVELLFLMELRNFLSYPGRVILIFGRDSLHNPCRGVSGPKTVLDAVYPAGHTVSLIDGAHGE